MVALLNWAPCSLEGGTILSSSSSSSSSLLLPSSSSSTLLSPSTEVLSDVDDSVSLGSKESLFTEPLGEDPLFLQRYLWKSFWLTFRIECLPGCIWIITAFFWLCFRELFVLGSDRMSVLASETQRYLGFKVLQTKQMQHFNTTNNNKVGPE